MNRRQNKFLKEQFIFIYLQIPNICPHDITYINPII